MPKFPSRIICLTAECTEIVYALGAGERVVGVSGYSVRPPEARKKPKVGAYRTMKLDKISQLKPDLLLAFSDIQKDVVRDLIERGFTVLTLNQRSLSEIADAILLIGRVIGEEARARTLSQKFLSDVKTLAKKGKRLKRRLTVYFEEWNDPLITGIKWVGELIEVAGGEDAFGHLAQHKNAKDRIISPEEVMRRNPDVIIASWCGKKANLKSICARPGWERIKAVQQARVHEIKSANILQPGPSVLEGLDELHTILANSQKS